MGIGVLELLVLLAAVSGSAWVVGVAVWLLVRVKRLEEGGRPALPPGEVEGLRRELERSGVEIARLEERLEFMERLIEKGE